MSAEKVTYELSLRDLMSKGLTDINSKLDGMERKLGGIEKTANKAVGGVSDSFRSLKSVLAAIGLFQLGGEVLDTASKMETLKKAIVFASGSSEEGAKNLAFLKDITKKMPIDLMAAMEGWKTFGGAVMGSGIEGAKARNIFYQVSKAAAVMGLSADDSKGIFLAMGQMVSKGSVQAEELKGQLGERLPGAFQAVAKSMGMTTRELGDQMKAGNILAEDMLPKLAEQLNLTYTKGMGSANDSINANRINLQNLKYEIIEGSIPTVKALMSAVTEAAFLIKDNFGPLSDVFSYISFQFNDLLGMTERLFGTFGTDKSSAVLTFFKTIATTIQLALIPAQMLYAQLANVADLLISISTRNFDGLWDRVKERSAKPFTTLSDIWSDTGSKKEGMGESSFNSLLDQSTGGTVSNSTDKLKKQSESVSGGVPKVVNINIEAVMKDTNNYFGEGGLNSTQGKNFLDDLQEAVNTIILDTGIVAQYGR
jgi:tape measure domain-containing protein